MKKFKLISASELLKENEIYYQWRKKMKAKGVVLKKLRYEPDPEYNKEIDGHYEKEFEEYWEKERLNYGFNN